jgi:hypothetical protein
MLVLAASVAGCAEIFGLGDYIQGDASVLTDALADVAVDVPVIGLDGCAGPSLACVAPLPSGWAFTAGNPNARPACTSDYGTPTDVEEGLTAGAASCNCSCSVAPATCSSLVFTAGTNAACNNDTAGQTETYSSGCTMLSASITTVGEQVAVTATPQAGGCVPDGGAVVPPVSYANQGRTCELEAIPGGCDAGVCVPSPAPFFGICVQQAGIVTCPSGYPVQHLVGSTLNDQRGCDCPCDYEAGSCGGVVNLYNSNSCGGTAHAVQADGGCTSVTNHTYQSFTYAATQTPGNCTAGQGTPTGDASFADTVTVCCAQ